MLLPLLQKSLGGNPNVHGDYDNDLLLNRIQGGSLLRIGFTNKQKFEFTNLEERVKAYVYADQYRDLNDIVSACILSSYIPIVTGPLMGAEDPFQNLAVQRAWRKVKEMHKQGFIKNGLTNNVDKSVDNNLYQIRQEEEDNKQAEKDAGGVIFFDGGFANNWPTIDEFTVIATPLNGVFSNPNISPNKSFEKDEMESGRFFESPSIIKINDDASLGFNYENLDSVYKMVHSSEGSILEEKFQNGYDDARKFLDDKNMISTVAVPQP